MAQFVARLEQGLLLHSPSFRHIATLRCGRRAASAATKANPTALRRQVAQLVRTGARRTVARCTPDGSLRAALIPHIDYARGGLSYTPGLQGNLREVRCVAVRHHRHLALQRPSLHAHAQALPDAARHRADRSGLYRSPGRSITATACSTTMARPFPGAFDRTGSRLSAISLRKRAADPHRAAGRRLVSRLRRRRTIADAAERYRRHGRGAAAGRRRETKEPICYIISGDLAHIGPKFDPLQRLDSAYCSTAKRRTRHYCGTLRRSMWTGISASSPASRTTRSICGLPPTFATLEASNLAGEGAEL